jgi:hypothetical protein
MTEEQINIVDVSGGNASALCLLLAIERYGKESIVARFADTKTEDPDLYRFLDELESLAGVPIIRLVDGRSIWDVFTQEAMFTNPQTGGCLAAWKLKKKVLRDHLDTIGAKPESTVIHIGFDGSEQDRMRRIEKAGAPWKFDYPLTWGKPLFRCDIDDELRRRGLTPCGMYERGYGHANCGGACIQAGQGQWAMVLADYPERYAEAERCEAVAMAVMAEAGRPVQTILRSRKGGVSGNLSLKQLREEIESGVRSDGDDFRVTQCSCMGDLFT